MSSPEKQPIRAKLNVGVVMLGGGESADIPTKVSQLENDAGYTTRQQVDTQLSEHTGDTSLHVTKEQTSRWDNKLDAVVSPAVGHFAVLDAQGHVIDGGVEPADFRTVCIAETLLASDWTEQPFQQALPNPATEDIKNGVALMAQSVTEAEYAACTKGNIRITTQTEQTLVFTAFGEKPATDIPITILLWR